MLRQRGVLAIWNDVEPSGEAEFNDWYLKEHLPERVAVPGFLDGRRYRACADEHSPRYVALYEAETPAVFASSDYLARLDNPTPWTRRVMSSFRGMHRTVCRVRRLCGAGYGGCLGLVRLSPDKHGGEALERYIADELVPELGGRTGILRAQFWQAEPGLSRVDALEAAYRPGEDATADWLLVVEGVDETALRHSGLEEIPERVVAAGAHSASLLGLYRLLALLVKETMEAPSSGVFPRVESAPAQPSTGPPTER